jgi:hypothetical protein
MAGWTEEEGEKIRQDSRCPSRDSNQAPFEYKSRPLPIDRPVRSNYIIRDLISSLVSYYKNI